jgi:hypothetical protein
MADQEHMRFPFFINPHAIGIIHIYKRHDCLEDLWMTDCWHKEALTLPEEGAKQLINQLQDEWSPQFLMELRKRITETLKNHDDEFGTHFA